MCIVADEGSSCVVEGLADPGQGGRTAADEPPRRVLLAEDHPGMLRQLARLLAHPCNIVGSSRTLIEAAEALKPDVVVLGDLDVGMRWT
jgi:hypothetical protein